MFTNHLNFYETVVTNYSTQNNIEDKDKRYRLGKVVAKAHETISFYNHQNVVYTQYAKDTQQDHPDIGAVETLREG